jgi:hypothetical protein
LRVAAVVASRRTWTAVHARGLEDHVGIAAELVVQALLFDAPLDPGARLGLDDPMVDRAALQRVMYAW